MKSIEEILRLLEKEKPRLKKEYGIKSLSVFGSYSRKEAGQESDVDILVDFEEPVGLEFIDLAEELEEILQTRVDLVSKKGIKPKYFKKIENDLVYV